MEIARITSWGSITLRSLTNSSPLFPGSVMSTRARSGANCRTALMACAAFSASPQTLMSGWRLIMLRSPSRIMGWSSTMRIFVCVAALGVLGFRGAISILFLGCPLGGVEEAIGGSMHRTDDAGAAAGFSLNVQGPANRSGTVLHNAQSHASVLPGACRQAHAIVSHRENNPSGRLRQADLDDAGFAMFDGVGDGLLGNPIQVSRSRDVLDEDRLPAGETAPDVEQGFCLRSQLLERRHQAVGFGFHRVQAAGQIARLPDGLVQHLQEPVQLPDFREGPGGELLSQRVAQVSRAHQELAQPIMQIGRNALVFPLADFQNLPFQIEALGNVAREDARIQELAHIPERPGVHQNNPVPPLLPPPGHRQIVYRPVGPQPLQQVARGSSPPN